ncbi:MAG: LysR family transcriptional regulator [Pseudobutyrivibrio sp.]|nr:LysR family transcriptional regulator [Pseudobutyrivibrio sp.]
MIEIKQLKYFVVAADVGSFSEAAKVLYTTQSSVSKVVGALENELGYPLFQRERKGIALTYEGKRFHARASELVAGFEQLQNDSRGEKRSVVKISANHSSWLANCFSDFYELHSKDDNCYSVHADTTHAIVDRIRLMEDEVGFIYIFPDERLQFEYELKKYQLNFESLKTLDGMIYMQPEDSKSIKDISIDLIHNLKFIQSEQDEYIRHSTWETEDGHPVDIRDSIGVITNSDYVMHAMLERNHLANMSADSFNSYADGYGPGLKVKNPNGPIEFGVLTNENGMISDAALEFVDYIRAQFEDEKRF